MSCDDSLVIKFIGCCVISSPEQVHQDCMYYVVCIQHISIWGLSKNNDSQPIERAILFIYPDKRADIREPKSQFIVVKLIWYYHQVPYTILIIFLLFIHYFANFRVTIITQVLLSSLIIIHLVLPPSSVFSLYLLQKIFIS